MLFGELLLELLNRLLQRVLVFNLEFDILLQLLLLVSLELLLKLLHKINEELLLALRYLSVLAQCIGAHHHLFLVGVVLWLGIVNLQVLLLLFLLFKFS